MKKILFVCSLNSVRSAMAETIVNEVYKSEFSARSAGLYAHSGAPMDYDARSALVRAGYNEKTLLRFSSRKLTSDLLRDCDIAVGMSASVKENAGVLFPEYSGKIINFPLDIDVPSAGDCVGFDKCFEDICAGIEKLIYPNGGRWKSKF